MLKSVLSLVLLATVVSGDRLFKSYNFTSRAAVDREWNVLVWNAGVVNNEKQNYVNSPDIVYTDNNILNIRTKSNGRGGFNSGRLESKESFSCLNFDTKKMRIEFVSTVDAYEGSWPALWMNGAEGTYGNWPKTGEIDVMEWVYSIGTHTQSSLHWKSGNDWGQPNLDYPGGLGDIRKTHVYRVDVSCIPGKEYIQFSVDNHWYPEVWAKVWKPSFHPDRVCNGPEANRCSGAAPFDNAMTLIVNVAVGGDWGGINVHDYSAFNGDGAVMQIHSIKIWELSP